MVIHTAEPKQRTHSS